MFLRCRQTQQGESDLVFQGTGLSFSVFFDLVESNVILDIKLWTNRITGEISRTIALDSEDLYIRLASEDVFLLLFVLIVAIHPRNRVGKLFGCSLCFLSRAKLRKQRKLRFAPRPVHRSQIRDARTYSTISPIFLVLGSGRHPRSVVSRSFVSHTFSHARSLLHMENVESLS